MSEHEDWFFVKVIIPKEHLGPKDLNWMPTLIIFEADQSMKGFAVFSSWIKAEEYSSMMSATGLPFERVITKINDSDMPLSEYVEGLINAARSMEKALVGTPVYIDPPDLFCKGLSVSYNSFQKFMRRRMKNLVECMAEHIAMTEYAGYTVALEKRKHDGNFGCTGFRGKFETREALFTAFEDAQETTDQKYCIATEYFPLAETAVMAAQQAIDSMKK